MSGAKDIAGKPRFSLLFKAPLEAIIKVREFGSKKYGSSTIGDVRVQDWTNAAHRHLWAIEDGEEIDLESGLPHLWHACTSLFLAIESAKRIDASSNLEDHNA